MHAKPNPIFWLFRVALGFMLIIVASASWGQFKVNQRRDWTPVAWPLNDGTLLRNQLQAGLAAETRANDAIVGQLLHVTAPALGLDQTFAAGQGVLSTDDVRVASNIKPFVSAAALKLVETGQLRLDAPIAPYLSNPVRQIMMKAGRQIDQITLQHLLNHSSGLGDYGSSKLFQALAYVPTAFGLAWHWTPNDQIWFAANLATRGPVGAQFDYSDTNYLLVSDMIAKATGHANAGVALRVLLDWPAIGAPTTFWEFYEPTPSGTKLVRHFRGGIEDTKIDVSFDQYGGGGLVMSMADLAHAHRAVIRGDVFTSPTRTRAAMQTAGSGKGSNGYGLGVAPMVIAGETCWGHGGRWGSVALHCPRLDLTIARSWGQSNAGPDQSDPKGPVVGLIKRVQQNLR